MPMCPTSCRERSIQRQNLSYSDQQQPSRGYGEGPPYLNTEGRFQLPQLIGISLKGIQEDERVL